MISVYVECSWPDRHKIASYLFPSRAGRQFSPDPVTNALSIGFMTVAMIDGINKIQVFPNSINILVPVLQLSLQSTYEYLNWCTKEFFNCQNNRAHSLPGRAGDN